MISHQAKKMTLDALKQFRERFQIPITDKQFEEMAYLRFADDSPEAKYLKERRAGAGWPPTTAAAQVDGADGSASGELRPSAAKLRRAGDLHDDGVRADVGHARA